MRIEEGSHRSLPETLAAVVRALMTPGASLRAWRARQGVSPAWTALVVVLSAIVALPLATILVLSLNAPDNAWPHLMRTVIADPEP